MKYISSTCFFFLFISLLISCTKNDENTTANISGRWNIVADSTFDGVGLGNHLTVYKGQTGDYCDFKTNGFVDIKEGVDLNTAHYNVVSASAIIIDSFYGSPTDTAYIENLKTNDILITTHFFYTPGGSFGRTLHLNR